MSDMESLLERLSEINDGMAENARRAGIVAKHTDTLIRFMRRKTEIHEQVAFISGMLMLAILLSVNPWWLGTLTALFVVVSIDHARNWYVRRVARKMFATDPQL